MSDLVSQVPEAFRGFSKYDSQIALPIEAVRQEIYQPAEAGLLAINNLVWLMRAGSFGKESAHSWRDYRVGAAVLAFDLSIPTMGIVVGGNFKEKQGDDGLNLHAEQVALAKARDRNLGHVAAVIVWGDPTDLDANPNQNPTLRPCRRCDGMFSDVPEVKPETLILSGNQDFSVCEIYTVGELNSYYLDPDAAGPISEIPPFSLADDMDDDTYIQNTFVPYLLPKAQALFS